MDIFEARMARAITPERRRELDEYALSKGLQLTRQENRKWDDDANRMSFGRGREEPTDAERRTDEELQSDFRRVECFAPTIALEVLYVQNVTLRLQEEKTQLLADVAEQIGPAVETMMAVAKVGSRMGAKAARRQAADRENLKIAEARAKQAEKMHSTLAKNAAAGAAALSVRVDSLLGLTFTEKEKQRPNDQLMKACKVQCDKMPEGTEKIEVFRVLARAEYKQARTSPKDCPWLATDKAEAVFNAVLNKREPFTEDDIETHAQTLKRRLNRAHPPAKLTKPKK